MDRINQSEGVIDWRIGQYSVTEIENVTGTAAGLIEDRLRTIANFGNLRKQRNRIEIALHRNVVTEPRPCLCEIDAPVEADHIATSLAHQLEQISRDGSEMDHRHP